MSALIDILGFLLGILLLIGIMAFGKYIVAVISILFGSKDALHECNLCESTDPHDRWRTRWGQHEWDEARFREERDRYWHGC